jgi:hypothetical protein
MKGPDLLYRWKRRIHYQLFPTCHLEDDREFLPVRRLIYIIFKERIYLDRSGAENFGEM